VNVNVGAAYAGAADADEHFIVPDRRNRNILEHESHSGGLFDESLHE
jgi:hypothetical protein